MVRKSGGYEFIRSIRDASEEELRNGVLVAEKDAAFQEFLEFAQKPNKVPCGMVHIMLLGSSGVVTPAGQHVGFIDFYTGRLLPKEKVREYLTLRGY